MLVLLPLRIVNVEVAPFQNTPVVSAIPTLKFPLVPPSTKNPVPTVIETASAVLEDRAILGVAAELITILVPALFCAAFPAQSAEFPM